MNKIKLFTEKKIQKKLNEKLFILTKVNQKFKTQNVYNYQLGIVIQCPCNITLFDFNGQ